MMRAQVEHDEAMRRDGRTVAVLAGCMALVLACGPDPGGKFDDFAKQVGSDGMSSGGDVETGSTGDTGETTEAASEPTTGEPAVFDINGDFLLAVSTTVDRSKPLQFIATNTVVDAGGAQTLSTCLQPLTLSPGKVLVPREPIGDPLCFEGLAIMGGKFTIDAGTVMVTGMANPITGSDITATLKMIGSIQSDDAYCGEVDGEVLNPAIGPITGSSFAAVRLTDKTALPTDVTIDCMGTTVTDK